MKRFLGICLAVALSAVAQDVLSNDSVVKMVKAGLGDSLIISMVQKQAGKYQLTPDDLVKLKGQGVTDNVLSAMVAKNSEAAPSGSSNPTASAAGLNADLPSNLEVGAYYKKAGKWEEMLPEVVNWKSGGVMKSFASGGIVKGDVNGRLQGANSRNSLTSPVEVVIYVPEGTAITEYQLLRLRAHGDSREFRTMTGGVMHMSGGATRDVVPFEGKKAGSRTFSISLANIGAGEYGFLPPGAIGSANSASIGKMYSFHVVE